LFIQRLITAAIGIPLVAAAIWVGDGLLAAVVALAAFIATMEFAAARHANRTPMVLLSALASAALPAAAYAGEEYFLGAIVGVIVVLSAAFTLTNDPPQDVQDWVWGLATALYFGALASYLVLLREADGRYTRGWSEYPPQSIPGYGRDLVFFTVLTVWATDTGAYAVGRLIGRHKLAPAISPGKTIEGTLGSLVTGFIAVFVLNEVFDLGFALEDRIALGLILPPVIGIGDLAESALKRSLSIKDSSGLVPGHGGVADRLDSLLFAAPAVYYYLLWVL
jgi:phosphatidate cytidylyltransferase